MEILLILVLAVTIDLALGDPPNAVHPVAWMGKVASFLEKGGSGLSSRAQLFYGVLMVLVVLVLFVTPVYFALYYLEGFNSAVYVIAGALLFKSTFSLRYLRQAALKVKGLLQEDKPDEARVSLRALVSRDTQWLTAPQVVSATVESVAENATDSFIAPLFYFLLFGIPGAIAYRVVNTFDSMIGYHGKYEYLGKFASQLDDVLNYIPARITALLLVFAAFLYRRNSKAAWRVARSEHAKTESPNAGWTMAATAGALNIRLEKVGHYKLGTGNTPLKPEMINASVRLVQIASLTWAAICLAIGAIYIVITT